MICKQESLFLHMIYQQQTILIPFKIQDELTKNTGCYSTSKKDFHARIICNEPRVPDRAFLCKIRPKKPREEVIDEFFF